MSTKIDTTIEKKKSVDLKKREFMGKVGKYAAVSAGMATLMTPTASSASSYGCTSGSWSNKKVSWSNKKGSWSNKKGSWSNKRKK